MLQRKFLVGLFASALMFNATIVGFADDGLNNTQQDNGIVESQLIESLNLKGGLQENTKENLVSTYATTKSKTIEQYQGSFLMYAYSKLEWKYDGNKILWDYPSQEVGWVFPNNITKNGINTVESTSSYKRYDYKYTAGAGVVSPWGNVNVYNLDVTHTFKFYGDGNWN